MCTILHRLVYEAVKQIPRGMVSTYKAVAEALGDPVAARAVARILSENEDPGEVPCHRVVMSDGRVGGYAFGGEVEKKRRLLEEGVTFDGEKVRLEKHLFDEFDVYPILKKMAAAQETLARLNMKMDVEFEYVVGLDVAYKGCRGVGAAVLMDLKGNVLDVGFWEGRVTFPYVPTYLAFREAPFMVGAAKKFGDVLLLIDGHGVAHPRKAGEAVHIGAVLGLPSIGVAKRPLMKSHPPFRGVYVSPGYGLPDISVVERVWFKGRKQPEALELAHRFAKERVKVAES